MSIFETLANGSSVVLPGYLRATPSTATCTISMERENMYLSIIMVIHWSVGTVRYRVDVIASLLVCNRETGLRLSASGLRL